MTSRCAACGTDAVPLDRDGFCEDCARGLDGQRRCRGCWKWTEYVWCGKCAKAATCAHGNRINDGCSHCDVEGDLAFDSWREGQRK